MNCLWLSLISLVRSQPVTLQQLPALLADSDWSLPLAPLTAPLVELLAAATAAAPRCEDASCARHSFLSSLTLGVPNFADLVPKAALFLAENHENFCCATLQSAAWLLLDSDFTVPGEVTVSAVPDVPDALQRARHSYRSWLRQVSDAGADVLTALTEVPGAVELFRLFSWRSGGLRECKASRAISHVLELWSHRKPASTGPTATVVVEFDVSGRSSCAEEALTGLQGLIGQQIEGYKVGPWQSSLQPGLRMHYVSNSSLRIPEDVEIVILVLDGHSRDGLMLSLKALAGHLSLGLVFSISLTLSNPYHHSDADDPMAVYEFLVWHGFRLELRGRDDQIRSVGELQLAIATATAPAELQVLALPRKYAPHSVAGHSVLEQSCVKMDERPNSWAEVTFEGLSSSLQDLAQVLGRKQLGVVLSANAYDHDELLVAETLMRHPRVKSIFFLNHQRAMQASQQSLKELVLLTQPPLESLCSIARSGVSVAVQSLRWLVAARELAARWRRCGALKLHLEVETGVGRTGLKGVLTAAHIILKAPMMRLEGLFTKLCCSQDAAATARSLFYLQGREALLRALLRAAGRPPRKLSVHVGGGLAVRPHEVAKALSHFPTHWLLRMGESLFRRSDELDITWKTTISALRFLSSGHFGYCAAGTACDARPAVPRSGTWVAVLPVGFAEFRGAEVFLGDSAAQVLSSGASTTVVQLDARRGDVVAVGDVATLCVRCAMNAVPWSVPRVPSGVKISELRHCWPVVW